MSFQHFSTRTNVYETPQSMFELQESMQVVLKSKNGWEPDYPLEMDESTEDKREGAEKYPPGGRQAIEKRRCGVKQEDAESFQFSAAKSDAPPEYTELVTEARFTTEADTMMSLLRPQKNEEKTSR